MYAQPLVLVLVLVDLAHCAAGDLGESCLATLTSSLDAVARVVQCTAV